MSTSEPFARITQEEGGWRVDFYPSDRANMGDCRTKLCWTRKGAEKQARSRIRQELEKRRWTAESYVIRAEEA